MFKLETRSLAYFRMGLAAAVIFDVVDRLRIRSLFFGEYGVYRVSPPLGEFPWFSVYQLSSAEWFHTGLLVLTVLISICLLIGFKSRISGAAVWFLVLNLQHFGRLSFYGGDDVLRLFLFWGLFLPLGESFSVDRRRRGLNERPKVASPLASVALVSQVAVIFIAAGLHKSLSLPWQRGEGVQVALLAHGTDFGHLWLSYPLLLKFLSYLVVLTQVLAPVGLFLSPRLRALAILVLIAFQCSLAMTMYLSFFPFVTIVGLIALWPRKPSAHISLSETSPWTRAGFAVAVCVGVVIPNLSERKGETHPSWIAQTTKAVGLDQDWSMFVPLPDRVYWIFAKAKLSDGHVLDLSTMSEFSNWRTPLYTELPGRIRWAALINHFSEDPELVRRLARAICIMGRRPAPEQNLSSVELSIVASELEEMRKVEGAVKVTPLVEQSCSIY